VKGPVGIPEVSTTISPDEFTEEYVSQNWEEVESPLENL
jgi:hypothetical protein